MGNRSRDRNLLKWLSKLPTQVGALTILAALTAGPQSAEAQTDAERAGARAAATAGADAFDSGKFQDALTFFNKAEALFHAPPHLLYIARSQAQLGKLVESRETYMRLKREALPATAPNAFRRAQATAAAELKALEPRLPYLTVLVNGEEGFTVTLNGKPMPLALVGVPHPVNPGTYDVQASASGARSAKNTIVLTEGARQTAQLTLIAGDAPPADEPRALPASGVTVGGTLPVDQAPEESGGLSGTLVGEIAGLGVGVLGIGAGVFFSLDAGSKRDDADAQCAPATDGRCTGDEARVNQLDDDANSSQTKAIISFGAGAAGLATAAILYFLDSDDEPGDVSALESQVGDVKMRPWFGTNGAGVVGSF